jgi:Protein of unknown function (DUF3363)/Arm DNA-binding domain
MLTDVALKALKPKEKRYKVTDRDGMYVFVTPKGSVSFALDYRLNGRRETVYFGKYGPTGLSLARARELCIDAKRAIKEKGARPPSRNSVAYAIVEGIDGRTHHLQFADLEFAGDAAPGSIVEARAYEDAQGRKRLSLATRSDLTLQQQISAPGATWLDRQLLRREPAMTGSGGFGIEVRDAMDRRAEHLAGEGLARRQGQRVLFARNLLDTLRRRELGAAAGKIAAETGLTYHPSATGEHVAGIYRRRVILSSGRFAMIDDGLGFQLVPWRPALEQQLGRQVSGVMLPSGGVDWSFGRKRGLGL